MFGLIKNKIKSFAKSIEDKLKTKEPEPAEEVEEVVTELEEKATAKEAEEQPQKPAKTEAILEKKKPKEAKEKPAEKPLEKPAQFKAPAQEPKQESVLAEPEAQRPKLEDAKAKLAKQKTRAQAAKAEKPKEVTKEKVGLLTKLKKTVVGTVSLSSSELDQFLLDLEFSMLAADSAEKVVSLLRDKFSKAKFKRNEDISQKVMELFRESLSELFQQNKAFDILAKTQTARPLKILMLGPNGVGKTTTIGKVTKMFQNQGKKVVFAAADTWRAASIEQLEEHANRLGVKVIKHAYGADPTAVAFDAVKHAEAHNVDVVIIDTAGRQETNVNLVEQLRKINRVIQPDLRLFIGEGIVGNAILEQIKAYKETIGLDGVILTKMDLDNKGGTVLSVLMEDVPVLYFGVGQGYDDLIPFSKEFLLEKMLS